MRFILHLLRLARNKKIHVKWASCGFLCCHWRFISSGMLHSTVGLVIPTYQMNVLHLSSRVERSKNSFKTSEINNAATQRNTPDILNPQLHVYLHEMFQVMSMGIFSVVPPTEPCALRSTQPLKVSTRNFSWGKGSRCVWLMTYHPCSVTTLR